MDKIIGNARKRHFKVIPDKYIIFRRGNLNY